MIYELNELEFYKINQILIGKKINLEIKAIVSRINPGWIFVDNCEDPKTALVWGKGIEGFYFVGDERNVEFTDYIEEYIIEEISNRAKNMGLNRFEFSGVSAEWDVAFEKIFCNRVLSKSKQYVYKHNKIDLIDEREKELPESIDVRIIDAELLESSVGNIEFVRSTILGWWNTIEDYLKHGIGFCTIYRNIIVSCCVASFVTNNAMESHIVTMDDYRKKGYAKIAVEKFLRYCISNNYEPYWDCMESNVGSIALAESLDYYKDYEYILYNFSI